MAMIRAAVREPGTNPMGFFLGGVLFFPLLVSCRAPAADGLGCTGDEVPAVRILVRDANTQAPAAHGVRGVVRDGAYNDSLRVTRWVGAVDSAGAIGLTAANERPGSYTISMERTGYEPWDTSGIVVIRGVCHVVTVEIGAMLQPTP